MSWKHPKNDKYFRYSMQTLELTTALKNAIVWTKEVCHYTKKKFGPQTKLEFFFDYEKKKTFEIFGKLLEKNETFRRAIDPDVSLKTVADAFMLIHEINMVCVFEN